MKPLLQNVNNLVDMEDSNTPTTSQINQASQRKEFSQLAETHHRMAILYARALTHSEATARDIAQDAFLAAWKNWNKFDITRDFPTWLRGIIRNKWREHCRKHSKESQWDEQSLSELEASMQDIPQTNFFDHLKECIQSLPEKLATPIQSYYYQTQSTAQSAKQLKLTESALRKRLQRARQTLKECLVSKA